MRLWVACATASTRRCGPNAAVRRVCTTAEPTFPLSQLSLHLPPPLSTSTTTTATPFPLPLATGGSSSSSSSSGSTASPTREASWVRMALDLDVDDGPSFAELVRDARRDVMKGRAMAACWSELADQHTFFKDIAKEGRARGEALAAVLAAVQGICQAVWCAERAHEVHSTAAHPSGAGPSPTDMIGGGVSDGTPLGETQTLSLVASAYVSLYASTPVPTRAQWVSALQPPSRCSITSETTAPATHGPSPCPSAVGRYLAKLRESVDDVARMVSHSDTEAEDGSFAEDELKELVRCCMSAGRRAARPGVLPAADARLVREMVKTLQDFVGSSTLEW